MSKLEQAIAAAKTLPPDEQDELADYITDFIDWRPENFRLTAEQVEEVKRTIKALDDGTMPTYGEAEMKEFWASFRRGH